MNMLQLHDKQLVLQRAPHDDIRKAVASGDINYTNTAAPAVLQKLRRQFDGQVPN